MSEPNPFAALSLIVAPAILTNACSIFVMSTSNRFARVVDRSRVLTREIETAADVHAPAIVASLAELAVAEQRGRLLVRALRCGYLSLSGFAAGTLLSLFGAVLYGGPIGLIRTFEALAVVAGLLAVGSLMQGSALLVRETMLAVSVIKDHAANLRRRTGTSSPV